MRGIFARHSIALSLGLSILARGVLEFEIRPVSPAATTEAPVLTTGDNLRKLRSTRLCKRRVTPGEA